MGHRNIETTMDIYAEATEEKKQESFENLATKLDIFEKCLVERMTTICLVYSKLTTKII